MIYSDYDYYKKTYLGELLESSFETLVLKASREIDKNVNTRLTQEIIDNLKKEAQDQLKYTACALADLLYKKEDDDKRKVSSISIDGVSKSFRTISIEQYKNSKKEILKNLPFELTCYL